ncbi:hypothetical protein BDN72DRAFT_862044 [Pluteus cervinus]|uniref:Uncharacterized protein n=1 Tax=Pluteus cervinus TaxID=181527 RepID=A0ACD3AD49_9AGAR|nr:hypothetical protein BDN72DRAFT_862044 [Pluteus cervinus]
MAPKLISAYVARIYFETGQDKTVGYKLTYMLDEVAMPSRRTWLRLQGMLSLRNKQALARGQDFTTTVSNSKTHTGQAQKTGAELRGAGIGPDDRPAAESHMSPLWSNSEDARCISFGHEIKCSCCVGPAHPPIFGQAGNTGMNTKRGQLLIIDQTQSYRVSGIPMFLIIIRVICGSYFGSGSLSRLIHRSLFRCGHGPILFNSSFAVSLPCSQLHLGQHPSDGPNALDQLAKERNPKIIPNKCFTGFKSSLNTQMIDYDYLGGSIEALSLWLSVEDI